MKIKKNGQIIRLSESDIKRIVKTVLTEEAMSDTNLRNVKAWTQPSLKGGMSYAPNEKVDGFFTVRGPLAMNAYPSKPKPLEVYEVTYTGLECDFSAKKGSISGKVSNDRKAIEWKVPFTMVVTPPIVKALKEANAENKGRIELGKVELDGNISNFNQGKPMVLSAFPTTTNIHPGAKRN